MKKIIFLLKFYNVCSILLQTLHVYIDTVSQKNIYILSKKSIKLKDSDFNESLYNMIPRKIKY